MIHQKQENHWHIRDVAIQKVGHVHAQEIDHHIIEITEQIIRRDHVIVIDLVQHPGGLLKINLSDVKNWINFESIYSHRRRQYRRSRSRDHHRRRYSSSSSSSSATSKRFDKHFPTFQNQKNNDFFLLSFMNRHSKKRRSLSSSSSSSSSSSKSSRSSSKSPVRRRSRSPPKSVEQKIRRVDPLTQRECDSFKCLAIICFEQKIFEQFLLSLYNVAKELDRTVRTAEKLTAAPNQISTAIVAPVNPAPIEVPPSEPPIIREEPKLPEVQVPIKKYYGRKRDTRSSTSGEDINYEEAESIEKNK